MKELESILTKYQLAVEEGTFVKLVLSKSQLKTADLKKLKLELESHKQLIIKEFYSSSSKEYLIDSGEVVELIQRYFQNEFRVLSLFTSTKDFTLQKNKNNTVSFHQKPPSHAEGGFLTQNSKYLQKLGLINDDGRPRKGKSNKIKQLAKFIEVMAVALQPLIKERSSQELKIIDMGAGKGYLTFALYDYLRNKKKINVSLTGVELRSELVDLCNQIAREIKFKNLHFKKGYILNYLVPKTDVLIALHACDIATDEAIFQGIKGEASLIVCAPCCHKQVRKQMNCDTHLQSVLQYGIFKERTAEMLTDTIRALILESRGYKTRIFEFISAEHTGKNILIVAQKSPDKSDSSKYLSQVEKLKNEYGIREHYLERLLKSAQSRKEPLQVD